MTARKNAACAGGIRNPAAFVRASEKSRRAGAKLQKNMDEIRRQPEVLSAMLTVVDTLGTKECAVPEAEVAKARELLGQAYDVTLDEDIGRGESGDVRSRYFSNLWGKLLMKTEDPEGTNCRIQWSSGCARAPRSDGRRS